MNHAPNLEAKFAHTGGELHVNYTLHAGDKPLLVFNRLRDLGKPGPGSEQVYRYVVEDKLQLQLGTPPLPENGMEVYARNVPHVSKLAAHHILKGKLVLPVPVYEYSCYFEIPKVSTAEAQVQQVILAVQYSDEPIAELPPVHGTPDAFLPPAGAYRTAKWLTVKSPALTLPVALNHSTYFSRPTLPR
jgi:hypothetical protein